MQHVEYDPELRRWYVRFGCDGRDAATIYFDLHQRTLRYELYFLPSPEDEARRAGAARVAAAPQPRPVRARFSLGPDGDVYLTGRVALEHLTEQELDRIIGVLFELTERWFQPAVTIAYRPRPGETDLLASRRLLFRSVASVCMDGTGQYGAPVGTDGCRQGEARGAGRRFVRGSAKRPIVPRARPRSAGRRVTCVRRSRTRRASRSARDRRYPRNVIRIALLGGGRMGEALVAGLLDADFEPDAIAVAEIDPDRRHVLERDYPGRPRRARARRGRCPTRTSWSSR